MDQTFKRFGDKLIDADFLYVCERATTWNDYDNNYSDRFQERGEMLTEVLNIMTGQATTVRTCNHYHTLKLQLLILHGIYLV